jgi:hypothetical protein
LVSKLSEYDPRLSSPIGIPVPDPVFYPSRIPDPGVKKAPDSGSGSATLVRTYGNKDSVIYRIKYESGSWIWMRSGFKVSECPIIAKVNKKIVIDFV